MTIFDLCTASHGGDAQLVMKCVSNWMESETGAIKLANEKAIDGGAYITDTELLDWLLILCGSMVFFMQVGNPSAKIIIFIGAYSLTHFLPSKLDRLDLPWCVQEQFERKTSTTR